jgi:hypothetical protein
VALKVQDPYVPGFRFPPVSVTVTRRLGILLRVVAWNWTPAVLRLAVSARAIPVLTHKAANEARPNVERVRSFVVVEGCTGHVLEDKSGIYPLPLGGRSASRNRRNPAVALA